MEFEQSLAEYLGLLIEDVEAMDCEILVNACSNDDMTYRYYFHVPKSTSLHVLQTKGWNIDEMIFIPSEIIDY